MTPVQGPVGRLHLQSVDDLARTRVILETLCTPREKIEGEPVPREAEERLEELVDHPLAPAMGILNGLRLSVVIWGILLLSVVLIW